MAAGLVLGLLLARQGIPVTVPEKHADFLLADAADRFPTFTLLRSTEAVGVIRDGSGRVAGVQAVSGGAQLQVSARLTVACDGRGDYLQSAYVVPKGGFAAVKGPGLEALRQRIVRLAPQLEEAVARLEARGHP